MTNDELLTQYSNLIRNVDPRSRLQPSLIMALRKQILKRMVEPETSHKTVEFTIPTGPRKN